MKQNLSKQNCNFNDNRSDRHVFDLDNTIIMTDYLNCISYNYALEQHGIGKIFSKERITRHEILASHKNIDFETMESIIKAKQEFFIDNINLTTVNADILKILKQPPQQNCIVWTSACQRRTNALLTFHNFCGMFKEIMYSNKLNIEDDVDKICKIFNCASRNLVFYEDSQSVIARLLNAGQRVYKKW